MSLPSPKAVIKKSLNRILPYAKFIVLIAAVVLISGMNNPRWAIPIRTGESFKSVSLIFEHANVFWISRTAFILAATGLGLIFSKFWCRFLCPAGGLLDIANSFSLFKYFMTPQCNDCDKCVKVCAVETRPGEMNCTNCGDCSKVCPVDAIKLGKK